MRNSSRITGNIIDRLIYKAIKILEKRSKKRQIPVAYLKETNKLLVDNHNIPNVTTILDKKTIANIINCLEDCQTGWYIPIAGTPTVKIYLEFYNGESLLGNLGVSTTCLTRDFFWYRPIETAIANYLLTQVGLSGTNPV